MKSLYLMILAACCVSCTQQAPTSFTIRGTIPGLKAGVEIGLLSAEEHNVPEIATATVTTDGEFFLTGQVERPTLCTLTTNNLAMLGDEAEKNEYRDVKWTYTPVFVENCDMVIKVPKYDLVPDAPETQDFHIEGSDVHRDYCEYVSLLGGATDAGSATAQGKMTQFIEQHPTSVVSVYAANKMLTNGYNLSFDLIKHLEQTITGCPKDTARYSEFLRRAEVAEHTAKGNPVVDLDLITPDGTPCQLADVVAAYAGKYLLIDFWASWCGICRAGTPQLKEYYAKYPREQFEIISVSSDEKQDAWHKAMEKDDMPWPQYCLTPQGMKDFFEKYQLIGVPYYLVVSPEGRVIANPGGTDASCNMIDSLLTYN